MLPALKIKFYPSLDFQSPNSSTFKIIDKWFAVFLVSHLFALPRFHNANIYSWQLLETLRTLDFLHLVMLILLVACCSTWKTLYQHQLSSEWISNNFTNSLRVIIIQKYTKYVIFTSRLWDHKSWTDLAGTHP